MKKTNLVLVVLQILMIVHTQGYAGNPTINIDFDAVQKVNVKGASGANLSWLLDSDKYRPRPRSMQRAIEELGVGALRFPYGHLADNYLWTTPPYENAVNGLSHRVATHTQTPGKWEWAVNQDGTFKHAMDFDEYIALCKKTGAEPLVVVNVLSYKYQGGPSLEYLIESAAAWVKYANVTRNYQVKYWQLGNEVEHTKEITLDEYDEVYGRMAAAMKAVDPTIQIGTGVLGNVAWNRRILEKYPELVGFVSAHQYAFNQEFAETGYDGWKELTAIELRNIRRMQQLLLEKPEYKSIPLMITETGATGGKWPEGRVNDLYKALYWFEMNMEQLLLPNVKYSFFWSTHTPWGGEQVDSALENLLTNKENKNTPTGEIVGLINQYLPTQMVKTDCNSKYLRSYAGISKNKKELVVFVLNKNNIPESARLNLPGVDIKKYRQEKIVFTGTSPTDQHPVVIKNKSIRATKTPNDEVFNPYSLNILRLYKH